MDPDQVNDDETYEIVGLATLETKGVDITSEDIAREWDRLLYKMQFTAERGALRNIRKGIMPPILPAKRTATSGTMRLGGK